MSTSDRDDDAVVKPSFGNMSDDHWSRARAGTNEEAVEYYRERSRAPGVKEGGKERNFYCMKCDGVIPHEPVLEACPHCGEPTTEAAKRYFNWVEINEPPRSDVRALMRPVLWVMAGVGVLCLLVWWWMR